VLFTKKRCGERLQHLEIREGFTQKKEKCEDVWSKIRMEAKLGRSRTKGDKEGAQYTTVSNHRKIKGARDKKGKRLVLSET